MRKFIKILIAPALIIILLSACKTSPESNKTQNSDYSFMEVGKETVNGLKYCFNELSKGEYANYDETMLAFKEIVTSFMLSNYLSGNNVNNDSLSMLAFIDEMFDKASKADSEKISLISEVDTKDFNESEYAALQQLNSIVLSAENSSFEDFQESINAFNSSVISSETISEKNKELLLSASAVGKYTSQYWKENVEDWKDLFPPNCPK
ncbi:hypothetical protein LJC25_03880 [Bacteroidales bacterium OttesenSCG-928-K03]|nr:hypothetical protein [Bacteroidales bacterium OttesenSCG-928-K22]MDL2242848.1 hypothetical protein [Bacteroidales bacterium OttesenSCG-928-K03]